MDNTDHVKNNQRKESGRRDSVSVDDEIQKLFKRSNGKINQQDFNNLRRSIGDEKLVEKIQQAFIERHTEISKKAKKFAELVRAKYADSKYPFHVLLEKAYKYKVKHGLKDEEFIEFQRIYETELVGLKSPEVYVPSTNIQKVLGNVSVDLQGFAKLSDKDYEILQNILKLNATSKPLHSQVLLQSMQYEDCGIEATTGEYKKEFHNVSNHIHPVIAALFLPKVDALEQHFIHSNITAIVDSRYNKKQFGSLADAQLYDALIKDPNDIVCNSHSTMGDLYNRAQLQNQLWNAVLSLRNGRYYDNSFREFITAVDSCRMNKYDSPDLIYGRYDGTILKRILSAFSFRPTVIATTPIGDLYNVHPYQQNIRPVVTYVPMINLKLPYTPNDNSPILLENALAQTQLLLENGMVVQKNTSLIYSRGVLFFYIDRRSNIIYNTQSQLSFNIKLPTAVAGFERLNQRPVNFDKVINIRQDEYRLRSVIVSEVNDLAEESDLVVGSSALIMNHIDYSVGRNQDEYLIYDPYSVVKPRLINGAVERSQPIEKIPGTSFEPELSSFDDAARTRGIVFMYELSKDNSAGIITY